MEQSWLVPGMYNLADISSGMEGRSTCVVVVCRGEGGIRPQKPMCCSGLDCVLAKLEDLNNITSYGLKLVKSPISRRAETVCLVVIAIQTSRNLHS